MSRKKPGSTTMSHYTVICHRCGKSTFVDLSRTLSDQRCRACRGFLQGVNVGAGDKHLEQHRKLVVKIAGAAGREPQWSDQATRVVPIRKRWPRFYRWVVLAGLIIFLGAIGYAELQKSRNAAGGHRESSSQEETPPVDVRLTEEWRAKATAFANKAMAAQTVNELLPLLFHPEVGDDAIRLYYETEEKLPLGNDLREDYFIPPGENVENAVAFSFTDAAQRHRAFVIIEKPTGLIIDWPSLAGLGEMPVKQYIKTMPSRVVVLRARARVGHYYNNYFSDSSKWLSIRLSDVTDENSFHGYVDRALPAAAFMESSFPNPQADKNFPDKPVIVVLKQPAGNLHSDQTQIIGLLETTWYFPGGLQPLIEQARKEDAVRSGAPLPENEKPDAPAPPEEPGDVSPPQSAPPVPGPQP